MGVTRNDFEALGFLQFRVNERLKRLDPASKSEVVLVAASRQKGDAPDFRRQRLAAAIDVCGMISGAKIPYRGRQVRQPLATSHEADGQHTRNNPAISPRIKQNFFHQVYREYRQIV